MIRPFPARFSALSSDALKELTSIPVPAPTEPELSASAALG